jgi:hypothetical protein
MYARKYGDSLVPKIKGLNTICVSMYEAVIQGVSMESVK